MIFWPIPISWFSSVALPSEAHTTYLLGTNWLYSTAATVLVIISYHQSLHNAGAPCYNWVVLSPVTSPRLCSWCQASTSFYDPFSLGPSTATEVARSPWPLLASHSVCPQLVPSIYSCLQTSITWMPLTHFQSGYMPKIQPLPPEEHSYSLLSENNFQQDFTSIMPLSS